MKPTVPQPVGRKPQCPPSARWLNPAVLKVGQRMHADEEFDTLTSLFVAVEGIGLVRLRPRLGCSEVAA
jgi:hypothetical protein